MCINEICVWSGSWGGVGGWVSEFWTNRIVYLVILTISMSNIVCL